MKKVKKYTLILFFLIGIVSINYFLLSKKSKETEVSSKLNIPLAIKLDSILKTDQKFRLQIDSVRQKFGEGSKETQVLFQKIARLDSINLIQVEKIISENGWLGSEIVGENGNLALFLVIQHSNQKIQEKYLPIIKEAAIEGKADFADLALLEDRVLIGQGKRQIYGSQIGFDDTGNYYVLPLEDPENVDKRRGKMGLPHIKDYLSQWGIEWDSEKYIKNLPTLEAKEKNRQKY